MVKYCKEDDAGRIVIILSEDKKQTIREHFPNADAVAIIPNPEVFIEDIRHSIGTEVKAENVHYFHIDKEFDTTDGQTAIYMEYIRLYFLRRSKNTELFCQMK